MTAREEALAALGERTARATARAMVLAMLDLADAIRGTRSVGEVRSYPYPPPPPPPPGVNPSARPNNPANRRR